MLDAVDKVDPANLKGDASLIYRVFTEHAAKHWKGYAASLFFMAIAASATAAIAYLIEQFVNVLHVTRDFYTLAALCAVTVILFATKGVATYAQAVLLARIGNRITAENQERIFDKLVQEGLVYFADRHSSHFMASALYGAVSVSGVLSLLLTALGRDLMMLVGLFVVMVVQDPLLSIAGLLIMPPAVLGVRDLVKRARHIASTQFARGANILQVMQETVQGFRVVKAFALERPLRDQIVEDIASAEAAANKMALVSHRSGPLMEALGGCAIAVVLLYGGYLVLQTGAAPGQFISFIGAFLLAYEPGKRIARLNVDLSGRLVGVRVLFDLLDSPPTEADDSNKPSLEVTSGLIEFKEVTFAYHPGVPVLQAMSFVAAPGRVTALVGPSGGGKSTVLNLLLRFYDVETGIIEIDGQDIQGASRNSLRSSFAYVGQEPFLFRGTVRDNIKCGMPGATDDQLVNAAKAAFAHDFISSFPLGYDTQVGEFGARLSMGQRQRVVLARALIRDAPIVLLDEPTASLDSESEQQVQEAIHRLCAGKTTLVIAHRLNTIKDADCILFIEDGKIVESGRHDELLSKGGRYATLFELQFSNGNARDLSAGAQAQSDMLALTDDRSFV